MASNWADVEAPTSSLFHWRSVDPDFMPSTLVSGRSFLEMRMARPFFGLVELWKNMGGFKQQK